ncbi:AraC family transcriptional regulator [Dyadobacter psychrotolerans]|uniref:AraC family transcriptional regulator n=1 Tax=Dyadobacter psychrotolerans TaxID=2541721 RepID=A0A4R5D8V6_9BACT|nr:helix-turn-helix domain-containing protein [Dyadobacter psychrotolerans]TDE09999.1 AraC family transcriptional regulator [Dyadobacter psychrotolerans]
MQHLEFDSPEELKSTIRCFWYNKRDSEESKSSFEVIPDGFAEIIFHFGGGCALSDEDELRSLPSPFLIGLLNQPAVFHTKGNLEIIGIRCFPWTVFDLLGMPSDKDGILEIEHPIARLHDILEKWVDLGKIEKAVDHLKQYFLRSNPQISFNNMLSKAGIAMRDTNGTMPVSQVAEAAHATVRTLQRNFKQSSGHTVKDVSGLMRFEKVRNELLLNPDTNLAGLAYELGYTDQPHLSREFKRYSGVSPAAFARNAKKFPVINDMVALKQADDHA